MTYKVVSLWIPSFAVTVLELVEQFKDKVQASIDRGFRPTGGVESLQVNGNIHLLQAMVREDADELRVLSESLNGETGPKTEVRSIGTGSGGTTGVNLAENDETPVGRVCGSGVRSEEQSPHTPASSAEMRRNERHSGRRKA